MNKEIGLVEIMTEIFIAMARITWGLVRTFVFFIAIVLHRNGR